jgi:hypothetical protein
VCSFPECRNAGVKFCFCTHCEIPVAKRNFRIRHNHCDYAPPAPSAVEALGSAALPVPSSLSNRSTARRSPSPSGSRRGRDPEDSASTSSSIKQARRNNKRKKAVDPQTSVPTNICRPENEEPSNADIHDYFSEGGRSPISDDDDDEGVTHERMDAWDKLLQARPRNIESTDMASWLMSVLAVSNVEVPVEQTTQPLPWEDLCTTSSGGKLAESQQDSDADEDVKRSKRPRT